MVVVVMGVHVAVITHGNRTLKRMNILDPSWALRLWVLLATVLRYLVPYPKVSEQSGSVRSKGPETPVLVGLGGLSAPELASSTWVLW